MSVLPCDFNSILQRATRSQFIDTWRLSSWHLQQHVGTPDYAPDVAVSIAELTATFWCTALTISSFVGGFLPSPSPPRRFSLPLRYLSCSTLPFRPDAGLLSNASDIFFSFSVQSKMCIGQELRPCQRHYRRVTRKTIVLKSLFGCRRAGTWCRATPPALAARGR